MFETYHTIHIRIPQDTVSEHPERFFVSEIIREKIFQLYEQEIPYCTTVRLCPLLLGHLAMVPLTPARSCVHSR